MSMRTSVTPTKILHATTFRLVEEHIQLAIMA